MKKIISLVLAAMLCLPLCACGQKTQSNVSTNNTQENNEDKIVFPEPLLLVESDELKMELIGFNQNETTLKGDTFKRKYIALKIHNKASYEIMLKLENLAVNDEEVKCYYHQQSSTQYPRILAGDPTTYYIEIRPIFENALNSMEDLYHLKGRIQVGEHIIYQGYDGFGNASDHYFSVPDAMSNN